MKIFLTGHGSFARNFLKKHSAEVVSIRSAGKGDYDGAHVIIHNGANTKPKSFDEAYKDNILPLRKLIHIAPKTARIVFLSSMALLKNKDEVMDFDNMSNYARSKYSCEEMLSQLWKNSLCVRFSTIFFGEKGKDGLSDIICEARESGKVTLLNLGSAKRDFIPIGDAVDFTLEMALSNGTGKVIAASGKETSYADVAKFIGKLDKNLKVENRNYMEKRILSKFDKTVEVDLWGKVKEFYENRG